MATLREDADKIIKAALEAALPDNAVKKALEGHTFSGGRVRLVAAGKAAWQMAKTASDLLGSRIEAGVVVTKYGHSMGPIANFDIWEAGHPVPDENSFRGAQAAIDLVKDLTAEDTVLFLVSGGGSALFEKTLVSGEELADITKQLLACGADKVSVNSGAVRNPALIGEAARRYGDQCVVLSVDVKRVDGSYHVFLNGGRVDTGLDALEWVRRGVDAGAGEVVVNSMDTDGVKGGFDVELLKAVSRAVSVPVVASGGAGSAADFAALFRALPELSAGLAASIFHFGEVTIPALKRVLAEEGVCVRL